LCDRFDADYVVIALDGGELAEADEATAQLVREDIPFAISPPMGRLPVFGATPHYFFNHNVMLMAQANNLAQPFPRFLKRSMDVGGALFGLFLAGPVLLVLAALVARDGGPVFFRDMRVGLDGRPFACLKFRSMVVDSDAALEAYLAAHPQRRVEWEKYHKLRDTDPRVTKVGAFMRKWSLDELPQLINVLVGDMSLVGPRPVNIGESQEYRIELLQYLRVRPGLTGLWQVSGRSNVSFARRVQMDAWYVRNWSLWHDCVILLKTIPAVVKKKGAC
jgi:undecaprenyl-phosphate galactose phosphotransferase